MVLAGALVVDRFELGKVLTPALLLNLSRGALAFAFLLAWRFQRGRVAWVAVLLAAASEALLRGFPEPTLLEEALAVLLPANLAVLGFLHDWKVLSRTGLWRFAILAAEAVLVAMLVRPELESVRRGLSASLVATELDMTGLPQTGLLCFILAAIALLVCAVRSRTPIEAALLVTLAACWLALAGNATTYYLAVAGLVLGLSLVENAFSLAFEDGLTGLPARRSLEESLRHLGSTYSIAMVDLDHFKKFNDRHGHEVGDQVLQMVASKMERVGGGGKAYRYGGEEFSVLFAGKTAKQAQPALEDLRKDIAEATFTVRSPGRPKKKPKKGGGKAGAAVSKSLKVTVSIGLAERGAGNRQPEEVMKAADKALYRSKKAGRNRVTVGR